MSRTTYTSTASYALPVGWKCTSCGQINTNTCTISAKGSASKQGVFHSQATANQASMTARSLLTHQILQITADINANRYHPAFNGCFCRKCHHREPWATVKSNGRWIGICILPLFLSSIFALISIFAEDWGAMGIGLAIAAACLGLIGLSIKKANAYSKKMAPVFESLKDTQKPICTPDIESLRIQMAGVLAQCPEDMAEINKAISNLR